MAVKFLNGIDVDGSMNIAASDVPNLDASKITSGTLSADRIPNLSGTYQPAGDYLTLETAETSFQPIGNYLTSIPAEYLTQTEGDARYLQTYDGLQSSHVTAALGYVPYQEGTPLSASSLVLANIEKTNVTLDGEFGWDANDSAAPASLGVYGGSYPDGVYFAGSSTTYTVYHTGHFTGTHIANWQTAYGWGNHASAGYLTSLPSHNHDTLYDTLGSAAAVNDRIDEEILPQVADNATGVGNNRDEITALGTAVNGKLSTTGGTLTGQVIFPSAATTKPVLPNGFISRNDNADIDNGRHDIWGISERYYPSNSTAGDAWGIQWSGTPNDIVFVGGGEDKVTISLDEGNITTLGSVTANGGNSSQWSTAYSWGNHASAGYLTSVPSGYATDSELAAVEQGINERIDTEVFDAIATVDGNIPTNNNQLANGAGYITGVNWAGVGSGTRTNYDLKFRPGTTGGYAGFEFTKYDGNYAGYFLVKGTTSNDVYKADGITLVADGSWLTLAQRTSDSAGVRIMTGATSQERLIVRNDGSVAINPTSAWNSTNAALTVGSGGDGRIQTRHIWGKNSNDDAPDDLWLNYANAGKHVQIGQNGGGNNLYVAGDIFMNGYFGGNKVATESYVNIAVGNLVDSAPGALNTLNELAAALGDDANFSTTVANNIAGVNSRIDEEVLPQVTDNATGITNNRDEITAIGTAVNGKLDATAKAADSNLLDGINSTSFLRSDVADTAYGDITLKYNTEDTEGYNAINFAPYSDAAGLNDYIIKASSARGVFGRKSFGWHVHSNSAFGVYSNGWEKLFGVEGGTGNSFAKGNFTANNISTNQVFMQSITSDGTIANDKGSYLHLGGWAVSRTHASAVLVNTAYRADYATNLWNENISRFTNDSGYTTEAYAEEAANAAREAVNTRIDNEVLPIIPTNNNQLTNGAGYLTAVPSTFNATSIGIGSKVTISESTDRTDLLYINSHTSGWGGLQIGNTSNEFIFSLMGNGNAGGIYDDQNADWIIYWDENAGVKLHHNSAVKLETNSGGVTVTGTVTASGGNSGNWNTAYGWGNHSSAGYLKSIPSTYIQQTQDIVSGNIHPVGDREQLLGLEENRWKIVFCEILDSAGQHEKNLQNPEGEKSVGDYPTGTVLVWKGGKNIPCTEAADHMRMGIAVEGVASPLIQGAEPVLVTGKVNEGDYLVTSSKEGHAEAVSPEFMRQHGLYDCVLGKALESGEGESYLLKTWINI